MVVEAPVTHSFSAISTGPITPFVTIVGAHLATSLLISPNTQMALVWTSDWVDKKNKSCHVWKIVAGQGRWLISLLVPPLFLGDFSDYSEGYSRAYIPEKVTINSCKMKTFFSKAGIQGVHFQVPAVGGQCQQHPLLPVSQTWPPRTLT